MTFSPPGDGSSDPISAIFIFDSPHYLHILSAKSLVTGSSLTKRFLSIPVLFLLVTLQANVTSAASPPRSLESESLITAWPLLDYRENSALKTSKLSILGPLLTFETSSEDDITALRPLFHTTNDNQHTRSSSYYLYPLASSESTADVSRMQFLQLFQKNTFRKSEPSEKEEQSMLFPFYVSGRSEKYGPYTSLFPIYGDIYERFWRDEYHYVLFPLYGRTVHKGTTNYHLLWPVFSLTRGENESGFGIWPLYGQAAKEDVYRRSYALWPIFSKETRGLNTTEPSDRFTIFPLYSAFDSPTVTSRTWLWPFFGYSNDRKKEEEERDYFWPLWLTINGKKRNAVSVLPFYSAERTDDSTKNWYLWPLYRNDTIQSPQYRQERDKVLFFLFTNRLESWAQDGKERQWTALWPLFVYQRDTAGERSLSIPAIIEPILDRDGIYKLWAPLWQIYLQKWNDAGDFSLSILWNLYWQEKSLDLSAWELFPLLRYRSSPAFHEVQILKGLLNYQNSCTKSRLSVLWIPFPINWQNRPTRCENPE